MHQFPQTTLCLIKQQDKVIHQKSSEVKMEIYHFQREGHSQANLDKRLVQTQSEDSATVAKTTANTFSSQLWRSLPLQVGQTQRELHC